MKREKKIEKLKELYTEYSACDRCESLCAGRTNVVFGAGNVMSDLMIIGSSPDKGPDRTGMPFSDSSGTCIQQAMRESGFSGDLMDTAYLSYAVMCWPFNEEEKGGRLVKVDREPSDPEIRACKDRLLEEIYIIDPKVIVLLGGASIRALIGNKTVTNAIREQPHHVKVPGKSGVELEYFTLVSWDPSYLLRSDGERRPGSPADSFYRTFKTAFGILEGLRRLKERVSE